ncbi:hypothetical protein ACFPA8_16195 [Streptomyces ovatisporus]|uniref:proton-translocating NAD(P)(+) transhydrogenase n=1 Tax=Streptomyces ovatisporus TaxID=1128682 RepID=A0ABV9A784_9ACTN
MTPTTVGVCKETVTGEHRVALVPGDVRALTATGLRTLVETGAGNSAGFPDRAYQDAGARTVSRDALLGDSDVLVSVRAPNLGVGQHLHRGQVLIALLEPSVIPFQMRRWADDGVSTVSMDLVPSGRDFALPTDAVASRARRPTRQPDAVVQSFDADPRARPAQIPAAASVAWSRNIVALLARMRRDGSPVIDLSDPVQAAMVVTHDGLVLHEAVWQIILEETALAGLP